MKKLICLVLVLMLVLSGCGLDFLKEQVLPDANVVEYRDLRYFAAQLDEKSYMNMCAYYEAAISFEQWCVLPYPMYQSEVEDLVALIRYECPELMMLDMTQEFSLITLSDKVTQVQLPYAMTEQEYGQQEQQTRAVIDRLARQCKGLSDREAEKLIYDYIVENCVYDDTARWAATAYGCLVEGNAKCDGISSAMKWALEEVGISCLIITGTPKNGDIGHAWNVVQLSGAWYDLDVTADVSHEQGVPPSYPAYNVSDQWVRDRFIMDGHYVDHRDLPGTDSMDQSYHWLAGSFVEAGQKDQLEELYAQAYEDEATFMLQFADQQDFEDFQEDLEARLEVLGNEKGWKTWSWSTLSVPDYRTISITAGE